MKNLISHVIAIILGIVLASAAFMFVLPDDDDDDIMAPQGQNVNKVNANSGQPPLKDNAGLGSSQQNPGSNSEKSPILTFPISFQKIFAGLVYFEEKASDLAINQKQCQDIIPSIRVMDGVWRETLILEKELQQLLTPAQERYILEMAPEKEADEKQKRILEIIAKIGKNQPALGMGKDPMGFINLLCGLRSKEGREDISFNRAKADAPITHFDIITGIIFMEQDPDLKITPTQARYMAPYFNTITALNKIVKHNLNSVLFNLSGKQIEGLKTNIDEIGKLQTDLLNRDSENLTKDPLFEKVIAVCREKAPGLLDI